MNSFEFLAPLLFLSGVAVVILAAVAIVQDMKAERKYGYRQAFYTIVTLVMLVMTVGSGIALVTLGLKQGVFTGAKSYQQRYNTPPAPYLVSATPAEKVGVTAYSCTTDCQFTEADKQAFTEWKTQYENWKQSTSSSLQTRRDLAGGLSLFLIALPLYFLFSRWMNRGAKEETSEHTRLSPLRSVYFYGVAFGGLVLAVVGGAMVLNTLLSTALKTTTEDSLVKETPALVVNEQAGADSVIACASKCGFTDQEVTLVREWKDKSKEARDRQNSNAGSTQNDLANAIPFVLFGIPLFWYHFARIRKETMGQPPTPKIA